MQDIYWKGKRLWAYQGGVLLHGVNYNIQVGFPTVFVHILCANVIA
jgi:hypothetical protein